MQTASPGASRAIAYRNTLPTECEQLISSLADLLTLGLRSHSRGRDTECIMHAIFPIAVGSEAIAEAVTIVVTDHPPTPN